MMRTQKVEAKLFYEFDLDAHVPSNHVLREIDRFLDMGGMCEKLKPFYSHTGRPSIDPELIVRMLVIGYAMGIRSGRRLCPEVHLKLAYRWFCRLGLGDKVPDHSNRKDGAWTRFEFEYDVANDQYIFPEGFTLKQFRRNYSDPNRGKNIRGTRKYCALKSDCQSCPSKDKCCPNAICISIRREEHEDAREIARSGRKTKAYQVTRDKRKKVEMFIAHLKHIVNLTR